MITDQPETLHVEGLVNLRDLGGLPIEGGGETRFGRLLRSDSPHRLDEGGARVLADAGVSTVVDLRTASERSERPNLLVSVGRDRVRPRADLHRRDRVSRRADHRDRRVQLVAARPRHAASGQRWRQSPMRPSAPILVHCHAGKDRTGVVVALVLLLAGVGADAIADDYALSGVQLADMLARDRVSAVERGMDEVRAERLFTVRREAMVETVERIASDHGGAASYLASTRHRRATAHRRLRRLLVPGVARSGEGDCSLKSCQGGDPDRI